MTDTTIPKRDSIERDLVAFVKAIGPDCKLYPWQETIIRQIESMPPGTRFYFGFSPPRRKSMAHCADRDLVGTSAAMIIGDDVEPT